MSATTNSPTPMLAQPILARPTLARRLGPLSTRRGSSTSTHLVRATRRRPSSPTVCGRLRPAHAGDRPHLLRSRTRTRLTLVALVSRRRARTLSCRPSPHRPPPSPARERPRPHQVRAIPLRVRRTRVDLSRAVRSRQGFPCTRSSRSPTRPPAPPSPPGATVCVQNPRELGAPRLRALRVPPLPSPRRC